MSDDAGRTRSNHLAEVAEDAVGFGGQEIRLTRDLIVRPRAVMDAYDQHGSMAGGLYPKPLRYYLTLNGLYLLLIALLGGMERTLDALPPDAVAQMAAGAGKSVDEFRADMDQWFSITSVPVISVFVAGAAFALIRRWSPADDRNDFHQTFVFMSAWTLYGAPFGLLSLFSASLSVWMLPLGLVLIAVIYARLGVGRWWRTRAGAWGKGALLLLVMVIAQIPAALCVWGLAFLGSRFLP